MPPAELSTPWLVPLSDMCDIHSKPLVPPASLVLALLSQGVPGWGHMPACSHMPSSLSYTEQDFQFLQDAFRPTGSFLQSSEATHEWPRAWQQLPGEKIMGTPPNSEMESTPGSTEQGTPLSSKRASMPDSLWPSNPCSQFQSKVTRPDTGWSMSELQREVGGRPPAGLRKSQQGSCTDVCGLRVNCWGVGS